jgi:hypothetical protein
MLFIGRLVVRCTFVILKQFFQSVSLKVSLTGLFSNCSGSTPDYCGTGCQTDYGICGSPSMSTYSSVMSSSVSGSGAIPIPSGSGVVSPDGSCGGANGYTCMGYGDECCSSHGYW